MQPIAAVMVHVSDIEAALSWYQQAFPAVKRGHTEVEGFEFLSVQGVQLEFVLSDEKVKSGACGSVVYWHVHSFEAALKRLQSLGATLYRGPISIEKDLLMCQVQDPWGNCIGLRGPSSEPRARFRPEA